MKLTEKYFEDNPNFRRDTKTENLLNKNAQTEFEKCIVFESLDKRIFARNQANLSDNAWSIHLDDEDFCSLCSFVVETEEQANIILGVYGMKL